MNEANKGILAGLKNLGKDKPIKTNEETVISNTEPKKEVVISDEVGDIEDVNSDSTPDEIDEFLATPESIDHRCDLDLSILDTMEFKSEVGEIVRKELETLGSNTKDPEESMILSLTPTNSATKKALGIIHTHYSTTQRNTRSYAKFIAKIEGALNLLPREEEQLSNVLKNLEHKLTMLKESHQKELDKKDKTITRLNKEKEGLITENISQERKLTEMEEEISQFAITIQENRLMGNSFLEVDTGNVPDLAPISGGEEVEVTIVGFRTDAEDNIIRVDKNGNDFMLPLYEIKNEPNAPEFSDFLGLSAPDEKKQNSNLRKLKNWKACFGVETGEMKDAIGATGWLITSLKDDPEYGPQNGVKRYISPK